MNRRLLVGSLICLSLILAVFSAVGYVGAETAVTVVVKDSQGNPISNAVIKYKGGPVSPGTWFKFGKTGPDGTYTGSLPSGYTYSFRAEYAYTYDEKDVNVGDSPVTVEFQTSKITVVLRTCDGVGLEGAKVRYRGSISPGTWQYFGHTGPDGKVCRELFPGNYWFRVEYMQTKDVKQQDVSVDPVVVFTTTRVTIWFSGKVQYLGQISTGTWFTFTKPTMEMLPGTFTFRFAGKDKYKLNIEVSGCSLEKSIIIAELLDHNGDGIEGGKAKYAPGGTWYYLGTTDANGVIIKAVDGKLGNVKVRMTYNQGSQEKIQYQPSNSIFRFQTVEAVIKLIDHEGSGLPGGAVYQGGGYWQFHGYTDENGELRLEMFPWGPYKFRVTYSHTSETKWAYVDTPVVFQTGMVHWTGDYPKPVKASLGGTWVAFTQDMELLPGTYKFVFEDSSTEWVTVTAGEVTYVP